MEEKNPWADDVTLNRENFRAYPLRAKMPSADAMAALREQLDASPLQAENAALRAEAAELHGFEWFARFVEWFLGRMVIVSALVGGFSGFLSLGLHVKAIVVAVAIAALSFFHEL